MNSALNQSSPQCQRIDKWLWCARFYKSRSLAAKIVSSGAVRLQRSDQTVRIEKPSALVQPNDQLSFLRGDRLTVVEVRALATRRGPASEAQTLYLDLSPPPSPKAPSENKPFAREKGLGRPTKRDRRAIDAIKDC